LDLRSSQFQNLANTFGMGGQLGPLNDFLNSPEGESLGVIYVTDLMAAMFGGLPTLLNVSVIDFPNATPEYLMELIEFNMDSFSDSLGDVEMQQLTTATINNLPGVRGQATADLSSVGMNAQITAKVVGLIANDKIYILTVATQSSSFAGKDAQFEQIIGSFRPE
ncbi:MAG: hypothetical protein WDZ49_00175, partial [Litorilinea sp.]